MENNKLSDLNIKVEHIKGSNYKELTIDYPDFDVRDVKYKFRGVFDYKMLDFFNVLIEEYEDEERKINPRVTIFTRLDEGHRIVSFPAFNRFPIITEGLRKIKKLIIPYFNGYAVFSYKFGIVTSANYDEIIYDEEKQMFHVRYTLRTVYGCISLFGLLDSEGHLIDNTLFIPELDLELLVDEHDLKTSIDRTIPKIERAIKRKINNDNKKEFIEWEYQQYLKRKRKNGLE